MRPVIAAWLAGHGLPAALALGYFELAAVGAIAGAAIVLARTRRDGDDAVDVARTLAIAYVAALAGGYVFEGLRHLPAAVAAGSVGPLLQSGRAAWGGLLAATLAAAADRRWRGLRLGAFFDRVSLGAGPVFFTVRTGCFMAGCDYGVPTSLPVGVRFPRGSLAALDHARRGWVQAGAPSLPVHPTQLYEALLGLVATAAAATVLRLRPRRDGAAFLAWLATYSAGRFLIELLRGDVERGAFAGLSTAQLISLTVVAAIATFLAVGHRRRANVERTCRVAFSP